MHLLAKCTPQNSHPVHSEHCWRAPGQLKWLPALGAGCSLYLHHCCRLVPPSGFLVASTVCQHTHSNLFKQYMTLFAVLTKVNAIMALALQTTAQPDHSVVVRPNCTGVIRGNVQDHHSMHSTPIMLWPLS